MSRDPLFLNVSMFIKVDLPAPLLEMIGSTVRWESTWKKIITNLFFFNIESQKWLKIMNVNQYVDNVFNLLVLIEDSSYT